MFGTYSCIYSRIDSLSCSVHIAVYIDRIDSYRFLSVACYMMLLSLISEMVEGGGALKIIIGQKNVDAKLLYCVLCPVQMSKIK